MIDGGEGEGKKRTKDGANKEEGTKLGMSKSIPSLR